LALVGAPLQLNPSNLTLCQTYAVTTDGANTVLQDSCAKAIGTTTFAGAVEAFNLSCANTGTFVVHLVPVAEDPLFGAANLDNMANRLAGRPYGSAVLPTASDFAKIDLDDNQVHEKDGLSYVMVFLNDTGPVDVTVQNATIVTPNANVAFANVGHQWHC